MLFKYSISILYRAILKNVVIPRNEYGVELLLNEVEILKKLKNKHPNIIQLKELFKNDFTYQMIFEKCKVSSYFIKLEFIYI